mgnify:CR=1 FL=1
MQWYELRRKNKIRHKQSVFDNTNGDYESHSPRRLSKKSVYRKHEKSKKQLQIF